MGEYLLPKWQRNVLFEIIKEEGFNPADFNWIEPSEDYIHQPGLKLYDTIGYTTTEFYYRIQSYGNEYYIGYIPGLSFYSGEEQSSEWDGVTQSFRRWLKALNLELNEPDLWDQLRNQQQIHPANFYELGNEPFSAVEINQIAAGVEEIKAYLQEHIKMTKEQDSFVKGCLDSLIESTNKLGKKDWLLLSIGTLVTISTTLALNTENVNAIWQIMKIAVSGVVKFLP